MLAKKTFLVSVFVIFSCTMYSTKAADEVTSEAGDKELFSKLFSVVIKCFKDTDWGACGEMVNKEYDITQPKYKECTCAMACVGDDLGLLTKTGEAIPSKFLEYTNRVHTQSIKTQMQTIYDKCNTVKGTEKCDLSEKFAICAFKESPALKERATLLVETVLKMKPK